MRGRKIEPTSEALAPMITDNTARAGENTHMEHAYETIFQAQAMHTMYLHANRALELYRIIDLGTKF